VKAFHRIVTDVWKYSKDIFLSGTQYHNQTTKRECKHSETPMASNHNSNNTENGKHNTVRHKPTKTETGKHKETINHQSKKICDAETRKAVPKPHGGPRAHN
jgi:hypothetical protein